MDFASFKLQHTITPILGNSHVSISSGKSQEQFEKIHVIPKLVAWGFIAVLENAIDSLIILGNMMDLPKVSVDLDYKSLAEKYSQPFREGIYDPETLETRQEALEKEKSLKFYKDRWVCKSNIRTLIIQ